MNILFRDKDHSWVIPKISFDYSVTIPIPEIKAVFSSLNEWSTLTVNDILNHTAHLKYKDPCMHKNFYSILECMKSMNTLYDLIHMYIMGGSHIGDHRIDLKNEVKTIETLKIWIKYANELHKLIGIKDKVELSDQLIIKIARETRPTLFKMPDNSKYYDETKSVIVYLSPYEDNTKHVLIHEISKDCITGKNKINKFLEIKLK